MLVRQLLLVAFMMKTGVGYKRTEDEETLGISPRRMCQPITISLCRDMPYNYTSMPNLVDHEHQQEADTLMRQFRPLIDSGCSNRLRFFLCSLLAPLCSELVESVIPSCQSVCQDVRSRCLPLLQHFGMDWPSILNCSRLPDSGQQQRDGLCMAYPPEEAETGPPPPPPEPLHPRQLVARYPDLDWAGLLRQTSANTPQPAPPGCPDRFAAAPAGEGRRCLPACHADVLYTAADKRLAELWLAVWAALCVLSSLATALLLRRRTDGLPYPQRAVAFISISSCGSALVVLLRLLLGRARAACGVTPEGDRFLVAGGLDSAGCIVGLLLQLFCGVSGVLWWAALCVCWYLAAMRHWTGDRLHALAARLHAAGWGVPAVLVLAALTTQTLAADELTGTCGVQPGLARLTLLVAPLALALLVGVSSLALAGAALASARPAVRLEPELARLGSLCLYLVVPTAGSLACHLAESLLVPALQAEALAAAWACHLPSGCAPSVSLVPAAVPLLRVCLTLSVGVACGLWAWWGGAAGDFRRLVACCRRRADKKGRRVRPGASPESARGSLRRPGRGQPAVPPLAGAPRRCSPV